MVRVAQSREVARAVRSFLLELLAPETIDFFPGQFVRVRFPDEEEWRDYSISSPPPIAGTFEITLNLAGRFTQRLFSLRPGDLLSVEGPMGDWHYREEGRPVVLISGGTGIGPFRSMLSHILDRGLSHPVFVFYSARTPADLVFREELEAFARGGVRVYTTITRPNEMDPAQRWDGPVGRLSAALVAKRLPRLRECVFYICGPAALVDALKDGLLQHGVGAQRLRFESWDR